MKVAFCTTVKNRLQHLQKTLPTNLADNAGDSNHKFIILNYGSTDELEWYLKTNHGSEIESGRIVVYKFETDVFQMGHAKNMAHRCGILEGCEILVNLDADNFTGEGFAQHIHETWEEGIFRWAGVVKGQGRKLRGTSGRIAVSASDFIKTGGYDEKYKTYSPDDKDFTARLTALGLRAIEFDRRYLEAVPHSNGMRFREWPECNPGEYEEFEIEIESVTVNFGKFGCGVVVRNFVEDLEIEIAPLPTRIFGIGMHKTATTSLHHALKILGFDSAHWKTPRWARSIWDQMNAHGRSTTLEKSYALSDLPIPLLFKQLDKAYPGSKFILTTRRDSLWLASALRHWERGMNPWRDSWNKDAFTHRIHTALYGSRFPSPDVMLERYQSHNREVLKYFRDRPNDLCILEMDNGAGWKELCRFFGKPVPNVPYPRRFEMNKRRKPDVRAD